MQGGMAVFLHLESPVHPVRREETMARHLTILLQPTTRMGISLGITEGIPRSPDVVGRTGGANGTGLDAEIVQRNHKEEHEELKTPPWGVDQLKKQNKQMNN